MTLDAQVKRPRLLLTGGSGLLALNWACAMRDQWDVVLGTHLHTVDLRGVKSHRLDLDDPNSLESQFETLMPDIVVHTAGLTDVDRCESEPGQAALVNAELARNVAQAAQKNGIVLIHISTDHLFADHVGPFCEGDIPNPLNEYGRSKLKGEALVQEACPQALVVRTNFFGWGHAARRSFSDWIIQSLRKGDSIPLFDDVFFTPILADALAVAAHELAAVGSSGVFNIGGDERVSKYDFGLRLAKSFALPTELIRRNQVERANLRANRPNDMSLNSAKARRQMDRSLGGLDVYFEMLLDQQRNGREIELAQAVVG